MKRVLFIYHIDNLSVKIELTTDPELWEDNRER